MVTGRHAQPRKTPKVGSIVEFEMGPYIATATIVEDRGPLGINGERVWRVRMPQQEGETTTFEIPAHAIKRVR